MFGFIMANIRELSKPLRDRYSAVYCGICRQIRSCASNPARLGLSYDMAFLALLLMSLYEPEETGGDNACMLHPIRHRAWVDNTYVRYSAEMNVVLAYYNAIDDYTDDKSLPAKAKTAVFGPAIPEIAVRYPRQCEAIRTCIAELSALERENCANPDLPAACFGRLMGELLVYREDMWSETLRQMGMALGRYIYLADAAVDYRRDRRKRQYNPFLAMGTGENWHCWEEYLVLAMGRCTDYYERLPLVQDKALLDNILYSGVWIEYRRSQRGKNIPREESHDR